MFSSGGTRGWRFLAGFLLLLFSCSLALGQITSGSISGEVKDPSGAYIPKATVTVTSPTIGVKRTVTTNADGVFVVANLPAGVYKVAISAQGFKQLEKTDVAVSIGDRVNAGDFVLQVGATNDTVTVEADAGQIQLQADSSERSGLITGKQLDKLGMNGRMIFDYVKVLPGITSTFNGAQSGKGGLDSFQINGARGAQHQLTLDGITNVDNGCNCASQVTINPDAIAEVKVLTSNYQAEYGKAAGGQMAISTKNGTNQFHGNGRWFHRHEGFNANQWFNDQANAIARQQGKVEPNPKQKYRYNYEGWQLGGPVLIPGTDFNKNRDKLYFFFSQEFYRQLLPGGYDKIYVPTLAEINGDFSKSTDGYGKKITVVDPATGQPFAGNVIPQTDPRFNKAIQQYMLKFLPRPNATDNTDCTAQGSTLAGGFCNHYNFITSQTTDHPRREDIGRLDYQVNSSNRLFFTVVNNADQQFLPEGMNPQGTSNFTIGKGMFLQGPGYNASAHLTTNVSNTMLNELTFGFTVNQQHIYSVNNYAAASNYNFGLPLIYGVSSDSPVPDFSFSGINNGQSGPWTYMGSLPWNNADTVINFVDNVTKIQGKHTLKAGIFVERNRKDQSSWGNANGSFGFNGAYDQNFVDKNTSDPYANALLGYYTSFQQQDGRARGMYRYTNLEFFVQDTYKITHRLTLDYGMRFAWVQPQYDAHDQVYYFDQSAWDPSKAVRLYVTNPYTGKGAYDPATGATGASWLVAKIVPGSGDPFNGMVSAKQGLAGAFNDRGLMPEPRLGFAYDLFGNGRTILRGGAGMAHDRFQGNPVYNVVVGNPPTAVNPTYKYGNVNDLPSLATQNILAPMTAYSFQKSGEIPTVYSFSLGLQRDLGWGTTIDVSYVGSQSRHLSQKRNLNAVPYEMTYTKAAQDPSKYTGGVVSPETNTPAVISALGYQYWGDKAYQVDFLRQYPNYSNVEYWTWDGDANYNSLQVSANKRFGKGLTFGAAYTWSKTMDTSNVDGDWTSIIDTKKYNYTLSSWDRTHLLSFNYVYDLPKFSKWLGNSKTLSYITDGFQLEGISIFQSGPPVTPSADFSAAGGATILGGSNTQSVYLGLQGNPFAKTNDPYGHMNPYALAMPNIGTPNVYPQRYIRSGGANNWDMSIFKNIPLGSTESRYIQLRLEAFNVFNHPQFYGLNLSAGQPVVMINGVAKTDKTSILNNYSNVQVVNPNNIRPAGQLGNLGKYFGEYNGAGNARVVQLGVKLYF